jgi:hypothetical protein
MTTIYFDMDGTLFNLYSVSNWLEKLRSFDPSPYIQAAPMLDMRLLAYYLNRLQEQGNKIGIISWLSAQSTKNYDELVRIRKQRSLNKHLHSVQWDEIHMIKYGYPKHYAAKDKNGILFDDNEGVRKAWTGIAYSEKEILSILKGLLVT